ncbi:MAG TPA: CHAT domain-containing protein [Chitinophagaceae bacterium]|nr:CHAT domain-containing protein [Chitinophagaceae bacterium]
MCFNKKLSIYLLLLFFSLLSCQSEKSTEISHEEVKPFATTENEAQNTAHINELIEITYDQPDVVISNPDSFLNEVKYQPQSIEGKEQFVNLLLNIGYVLRAHGNILSATKFYEKAYIFHLEHELKSPDFVLYIAKPLANLYTRIDDLQKSIALHHQAIILSEKEENWEHLPSLYSNLTIAYQHKGDYILAQEAALKGLSYTEEHSVYKGLLFNSMSISKLNLEEVDSATFYNQKAIQVFESCSEKEEVVVWYSSALKMESDIAFAKQQYKKAWESINKAYQLVRQHYPDTELRTQAKLLLGRGNLSIDKRPREAIQDFQLAIQLLKQSYGGGNILDYTYTESLHALGKSYQTLDQDSTLYYYQKAIESAFLTQGLIVNKASSYKNSKWNRTILTEYLSLLGRFFDESVDQQLKQKMAFQMFWAIEMSKGRQVLVEMNRSKQWSEKEKTVEEIQLMNLLQEQHQQLVVLTDSMEREEVKSNIASLEFQFQLSEQHYEQYFKEIDFEAFKSYILNKSKEATIVSYLIDNEQSSYIVSINDGQVSINTLDLEALFIKDFINQYFGDSPFTYENSPQAYATQSDVILQRLVPFYQQSKNRIFIAPDGFLYRLPIDALMKDGEFVVENHETAYTYSFILNFLNREPAVYSSDVILFAKTSFGSSYSDLNFVNEEVKFLKKKYKSTTYVEEKATIKSFLNHLPESNVLHLATHAIGGEFPFIVLDNLLTLGSLSVFNMNAPLVILSSCESGDGEMIAAEGLESLNKAFISKGTKGVIASQWSVDDQAMSELMELFYQHLYDCEDPISALAFAKRAYIKTSDARHKNPWYWAAMNYMGIETSIKIKKKSILPFLYY